MTWQFIESMILSNQWKTTDWTTGNLFKIQHICSFPKDFAWKYTGLIAQTLNDTESGNIPLYGEIKQLFFDPEYQYFWFNPLDGIDLRRLAIRGYWSGKTSFSWITQVYVWDQVVSQSGINLPPVMDLTELTNLNNQQLTLLNQQSILLNQIDSKSTQIITDINNLTLGTSGGSTGTNNNSFGNPSLI